MTDGYRGWNYFVIMLVAMFAVGPVCSYAAQGDAVVGFGGAFVCAILSIPLLIIMDFDRGGRVSDSNVQVFGILYLLFLFVVSVADPARFAAFSVAAVGLAIALYLRLTSYAGR